jgi:hypothetical protein
MGTAGSRIADLTRWELLRSKDFALLRHFRRNGLGLGNTRQQRGGSRQQKSKGSASHSPIIAHRQTPQLFAAIIGNLSLESADVNVVALNGCRVALATGRAFRPNSQASRSRLGPIRPCSKSERKMPSSRREQPYVGATLAEVGPLPCYLSRYTHRPPTTSSYRSGDDAL